MIPIRVTTMNLRSLQLPFELGLLRQTDLVISFLEPYLIYSQPEMDIDIVLLSLR